MAKQNSKSKKYFLIFSAIFIIIIGIVCIDIAKRTTFPGSKPQLKERILNGEGNDTQNDDKDSVKNSQ
ncbi:hypothetical protein [Marinigracilibium pacificum]|uniref:Uncharacterized protein n=1 Tax=Marinigracilibium pacificum TaxID=2729599 RepID=A0A848J5L8_9BACT|nr:hypothetical protein [Marinigracilibium pacificum]NMM48422.1 hypothetical protein [Marinigracilibium pacificum]